MCVGITIYFVLKVQITLKELFVLKYPVLCFFVWFIFTVGGFAYSINWHEQFAYTWLGIGGAVLAAVITALVAFNGIEIDRVKKEKVVQYKSYVQLLSQLRSRLMFFHKHFDEFSKCYTMDTAGRTSYLPMIMLREEYASLDLKELIFLNVHASKDKSYTGGKPENYDYLNISALKELDDNFLNFIEGLRNLNSLKKKENIIFAKKFGVKKPRTMSMNQFAECIPFVDYTETLLSGEGVLWRYYELLKHHEYAYQDLKSRAEEVFDKHIIEEYGNAHDFNPVSIMVDTSAKFIQLSDEEIKKLHEGDDYPKLKNNEPLFVVSFNYVGNKAEKLFLQANNFNKVYHT
jgi:hypothetical protein